MPRDYYNFLSFAETLLDHRYIANRWINRNDRRSFIINLTGPGKKRISTVFPDHAKRISKRMSCLSVDEQRELGRLLKKLGTQQERNHSRML